MSRFPQVRRKRTRIHDSFDSMHGGILVWPSPSTHDDFLSSVSDHDDGAGATLHGIPCSRSHRLPRLCKLQVALSFEVRGVKPTSLLCRSPRSLSPDLRSDDSIRAEERSPLEHTTNCTVPHHSVISSGSFFERKASTIRALVEKAVLGSVIFHHEITRTHTFSFALFVPSELQHKIHHHIATHRHQRWLR